ncbi:MAG: ACT domain-containing protein [Phycisphaerae bacterium]|nr:ACT domain-containing protein [Phycisphaerae bacterium]NUQ47107.1 ACT domain-containing protein [Phycisphaerae bacterium]
MTYRITRNEAWAGDIVNRPGMLARSLEALSLAGASLEFLIARRVNEDTSRVFVSPLRNTKQKNAARDIGMVPAAGMHVMRIDGPDKPGLAAQICRAVADRGVNIRGSSAAVLGRKVVLYLAFETEAELKEAMQATRKALKPKRGSR